MQQQPAQRAQGGVALIGSGGHASVVLDILHLNGIHVAAVLDDDPLKKGSSFHGVPIVGSTNLLPTLRGNGIELVSVGVGANLARARLHREIVDAGLDLLNAIHPSATVSSRAEIGAGTAVMAGAVINAGSRIGPLSVINTSASIDHDCRIADFAFIGPGVVLAGEVTVEQGAFIGTGAVACPRTQIGSWSLIGAGSVVTRSIRSEVVAYGVPAKVVRSIPTSNVKESAF